MLTSLSCRSSIGFLLPFLRRFSVAASPHSDSIKTRNQNAIFLPFAEAREFARGLNLRSMREWTAWCQHPTQRPPTIPAAPFFVYKGRGWAGFEDWLGYDKRMPKFFQIAPGPQNDPRRMVRESTRDAAYKLFLDFASRHNDRFQFKTTSQRCSVQLLFRPIDQSGVVEDSWSPLYFRCRQQLCNNGAFRIRETSGEAMGCGMMLVSVHEKKIAFVPREEFVAFSTEFRARNRESSSRYRSGTMYFPADVVKRYAVDSVAELSVLLDAEYQRGVRVSQAEAQGVFNIQDNDRVYGYLLEQLTQKLYNRCGSLDCEYPSISCVTRCYNAIVGGRRIMHKSIRLRFGPVKQTLGAGKIILDHRNRGGIGTPIEIKEAPDFVVVMDRPHEHRASLIGAFILPKTFLEEQGVLASPVSRGKRTVMLYPPHLSAVSRVVAAKQAQQEPYYINLSFEEGDPRLQNQIEKAKKLLNSN